LLILNNKISLLHKILNLLILTNVSHYPPAHVIIPKTFFQVIYLQGILGHGKVIWVSQTPRFITPRTLISPSPFIVLTPVTSNPSSEGSEPSQEVIGWLWMLRTRALRMITILMMNELVVIGSILASTS